jgi:hypothetical protein
MSKKKKWKRKSISKTLRFEVFKRDSFQCQYCGEKAPDVLLEIDHIDPVSKGGTNDFLNLITSCKDCNRGKRDRKLTDNTVMEKRRQQLAELQERQEQIEMMMDWQKGLLKIDSTIINNLAEYWSELLYNHSSLTGLGIQSLKKLNKRFAIPAIMEAMKEAIETYVEYEEGAPTSESIEKAWIYTGKMCTVNKEAKDNPDIKQLYYIRGILRNRLSYVKDYVAIDALKKGLANGYSVQELKDYSLSAKSWTSWKEGMAESFNVSLLH